VRRDLGIAIVLLFAAVPLVAQRGTADELERARTLYESLELERAVRVLRAVLSPGWSAPVAPEERVAAHQLLGAALVLLGHTDSAVASFRSALERDPFVDLAPEDYTPAQVGAFARARRQVFAVGARPVPARRLDPRTERIRFPFAVTHAGEVRAEVRRGDSTAAVLETGADGTGELVWDGLTRAGRLAAPGRYELRVRATSRLLERADSAVVYFDLRHEIAALEDTLPPLGPTDLAREQLPSSAGLGELGKGLAVAGGVLLIAGPLSNSALGRGNGARPALVAGTALAAGVVAFVVRRRHRSIPANIDANRRRQEERRAANDAIRARNADRVAATVLIITAAAGIEP
jgi:hypothetical protein